MSIRKQFVPALMARLAEILVSNGYLTNIGQNVNEWDESAVLGATEPCLMVEDGQNKRTAGKIMGQTRNLLHCNVLGILRGENHTAASARDMEEDIVACLGDWPTADGLVDLVEVIDSTIDLDKHGQLVGGVHVIITAEYYTGRNQC